MSTSVMVTTPFSGEMCSTNVDTSDTVASLLQLACKDLRRSTSEYKLVFNHVVLENDQTLGSYGVGQFSVLTLYPLNYTIDPSTSRISSLDSKLQSIAGNQTIAVEQAAEVAEVAEDAEVAEVAEDAEVAGGQSIVNDGPVSEGTQCISKGITAFIAEQSTAGNTAAPSEPQPLLDHLVAKFHELLEQLVPESSAATSSSSSHFLKPVSKSRISQLRGELASNKYLNSETALTESDRARKQAQVDQYERSCSHTVDVVNCRADHTDSLIADVAKRLDALQTSLPNLIRAGMYDVQSGQYQPESGAEGSELAQIGAKRMTTRLVNTEINFLKDRTAMRNLVEKMKLLDEKKAKLMLAKLEQVMCKRLEREEQREEAERLHAAKKAEVAKKKADEKAAKKPAPDGKSDASTAASSRTSSKRKALDPDTSICCLECSKEMASLKSLHMHIRNSPNHQQVSSASKVESSPSSKKKKKTESALPPNQRVITEFSSLG